MSLVCMFVETNGVIRLFHVFGDCCSLSKTFFSQASPVRLSHDFFSLAMMSFRSLTL